MNLLDVLSKDGFHFKRKSSTYGGEYAGPCPFCGGTDRFIVWPHLREESGGRYWCRQCEKSGDGVGYLMNSRRLSFMEACRCFNVDPGVVIAKHRDESGDAWIPRETALPNDLWRNKARIFLQEAIDNLFSGPGRQTLSWLHDHRGLKDESIKAARLGLNLRDTYRSRVSWGLAELIDKDRNKIRKIWLPAGLVIPYHKDDEIIRLRIRRFAGERGKRYIIVSGSDMSPMIWDLDKSVVCIVESELDGILLSQEAGDIADVTALGNVRARPDMETDRALHRAERILLCLDYDMEDGRVDRKFNWTFWKGRYPGKVRRWPTPVGKDPTEAYEAGVDLRSWIQSGL